MKHFATSVLFLVLCLMINAQAGMWTWMKGDSIANQSGVYGVQGIPSPANNPRGLYEAASWTDLQGNFWLFGGSKGNLQQMNDLWKYDPGSNNWTWVKGSGIVDDTGSYGTQLIPAGNNNPPARGFGAATWVDLNGDLWLYGGIKSGSLGYADLWKYEIASNMWTWVSGSRGLNQLPVYGTQSVPSVSNSPGTRWECCATWVDNNNALWLFGGFYSDGINAGYSLNDVWRYDITTNEWTWMKGSNLTNQNGVYGTKGIASAANTPGARAVHTLWTDALENVWIFGGAVYHLNWVFNDMWRYEPSTNNWTWMSGDSIPNSAGNYDPLCISSTNYSPAARYECRARWKDECGNFWMYGGARGVSITNTYCDLWCFNPSTLLWTRTEDSSTFNITPAYGTKGIPSSNNRPGGRMGSVSWKWNNGHLYLFGGAKNISNYFNDLWEYVIDTTCLGPNFCNTSCNLPSPNINTNKTTFCSGDSAQVCVPSGFANYLWNTGETTSCIKAQLAGNYYVTVTDNSGCTAESNHLAITVLPLPPVAISVNGDTLSVYGAVTQQWYLNGTAINNATSNIYIATQGGSYTVAVTDTNGCLATSSAVIISGIDNVTEEDVVSVYPNPLDFGFWILECGSNLIGSKYEILDADGRVVFQSKITNPKSKIELNVSKGVYLLRISSAKSSVVRKLIRL